MTKRWELLYTKLGLYPICCSYRGVKFPQTSVSHFWNLTNSKVVTTAVPLQPYKSLSIWVCSSDKRFYQSLKVVCSQMVFNTWLQHAGYSCGPDFTLGKPYPNLCGHYHYTVYAYYMQPTDYTTTVAIIMDVEIHFLCGFSSCLRVSQWLGM